MPSKNTSTNQALLKRERNPNLYLERESERERKRDQTDMGKSFFVVVSLLHYSRGAHFSELPSLVLSVTTSAGDGRSF